ncbi:MAG: NAD-binding protein [Candidatus Helarchaeota archaeon]
MCETISTAAFASAYIWNELEKYQTKNLIIIGCTNTARRLIEKLKATSISYRLIENQLEKVKDLLDEEPVIVGDAKDKDVYLKQA